MEVPIPVVIIYTFLAAGLITYCLLLTYALKETRKLLTEAQEGWSRNLARWREAVLTEPKEEEWPDEIEK